MVWARRRFALIFLDVDLEAFAVALVFPVSNFVAHAVEEGTAPKIDPSDKHDAEVTKVADSVSAGINGAEEFDGAHHSYEGTHGNHDRQRKEPDLTLRKENGIGDEDAEDGAGGSDGWYIRRRVSPKLKKLYEDGDDSSANTADEEIIQEAFLAPDQFKFPAKHPQHEHVDEEMPKAAVQKHVSKGLPNAQARNDAGGNKSKCVIKPGCRAGTKFCNQGLEEKDAGTG